ncbi:MAG TPA: WhiB family transcriptional regulator [Acidimicrobiales bacterium]|nr:WhiB family transcriptional regulator [Acidimicrobiales bacterium]
MSGRAYMAPPNEREVSCRGLPLGQRPRARPPAEAVRRTLNEENFLVTPLVGFTDMGVASRSGGGVQTRTLGEAWQARAACRGPQSAVFFPPTHAERKEDKIERENRAKDICASCVVQEDCLEYAIRIREPHGIWGGLNENERKQVLQRRAG